MERNELIDSVIKTIRADILGNAEFVKEVLKGVKLTKENIPNEIIYELMAEQKAFLQIKKPVSNAPKETKMAAQPFVLADGSIEAEIVSDLLEGNNVYLMGKAGTGKTYTAKAIAQKVMGQPTYLINCSQWTSPIEIRGGQTIKGYQEGELIKAWATGGILILDELPKLDPNTAGLLNDALAQTAAQPMYDENGNVDEKSLKELFIVNGKGDKIYKGQDATNPDLKYRFCVIATGNTDMMNVGSKYSGNQRQDYSLVDRFAGSFYTLDENSTAITEKRLIYPYVYDIANVMRKFLNDKDAVQSISLRTMLNFNRTYEQEMLYNIDSPYADEIFDNDGTRVAPKSVNASIDSFLSMLEPNMMRELISLPAFENARAAEKSEKDFIKHFENRYGLDPRKGKLSKK